MEVIALVILDFLFAFIGWVCLYVWYRDRKKVEVIKKEKYAGEFSAAGKVLILNFIAGAGALVMIGVTVFFLIGWIRNAVR